MSYNVWCGVVHHNLFKYLRDAILCMYNDIALMHYGVISVNCKFQAYWITQQQQVLGMMRFTGRAALQPSHKC